MYKVRTLDYLLDALKILADNPHSLLWETTDDLEFNGHVISVKRSTKYKQVLIDNVYYLIGGNVSITAYGKTYSDPLDFVSDVLTDNIQKESIDFGKGTMKDIREAISKIADSRRSVDTDEFVDSLMEHKTIAVFNKGSEEYKKLQMAVSLMSGLTGNDYYVGETYFDYGQGWKWTTVLKKDSTWGAVQVLTPRDQEDIINADSASEIGKVVDRVLNSKLVK